MSRPIRKPRTVLIAVMAALSLGCGGRAHDVVTSAAPTASTADFAEPGDHLTLKVWDELLMSGDLVVSPDGSVALPKAGLLHVSDIPVTQLRDSIQHRLAGFLRDPSVDVTVEKRVIVNGAVTRSGMYFVPLGATVRDAIAEAGGINEAGSGNKVAVIRDGLTHPVEDWEHNDSPIVRLESGDQVVVGRRSWLELNVLSVASLSLVVASFILSLRK